MGQISGRAIDADLAQSDPDIAAFINQERQRQETHLELIASENFASRAVMQAQGSVLTNQYAEGLPSKRYYGGCEHVDAIEELAIERVKQLFGAAWANVQPHSGAQANFAVFRAIADEVSAYLLADMAHIAGLVAAGVHPSPVPHCDVVTTTTHKTLRGPRGGLILCRDAEFAKKFDKAVFPGSQGGPLEHVIAAKAVAFGEALQPSFKAYSQQVVANAAALAEQLIARGIDVVSGGTDNHVVLLDLRGIGMTGKVADLLVSDVHITANKNTVPFDPESPFVTSGLRLGTAALTTRGFDAQAFREVADVIADRLLNPEDDAIRQRCLDRVGALCERFPLYADSKQPVLA